MLCPLLQLVNQINLYLYNIKPDILDVRWKVIRKRMSQIQLNQKDCDNIHTNTPNLYYCPKSYTRLLQSKLGKVPITSSLTQFMWPNINNILSQISIDHWYKVEKTFHILTNGLFWRESPLIWTTFTPYLHMFKK